jgi:outer membrane murein-binding lipoprotein Lpp
MRKTPVLAALAVSTAALAGCGGSSAPSGTAPASYVHQVCTAVTSYQAQVNSLESSLQNSVSSHLGNLPALKGQITTALGSLQTDTNQLKSKVSAAGTPAVQKGSRVKSTVLNVIGSLANDAGQAAHQVSGLNTSNQTQFVSGLQQLGTQFQSEGKSLQTQLNGKFALGLPKLKKAAAKDPACKSLTSNG